MPTDWILIANASRARVLQQQESGTPTVLHQFEHPASRLHSSELGDDESGRERKDGFSRAATFEPHIKPQRKEHLRFARELADFLEAAAHQDLYRSLRVFAPSPFLGELKQVIGIGTLRLVVGVHDLDLSSVAPAEIGRRIERALAQPG